MAAVTVRVSKESDLTNLVDEFAKMLGGVKIDGFLKRFMC